MRSRGFNGVLTWSGSLVLISLGFLSAQAAGTGVRIVMPADIQWTPVPGYPPGYARVMLEGNANDDAAHTYRVRLPKGFRAEPHTHPADEQVTVLQGTWRLGIGSSFLPSALKALPAGSFVVIAAGTPHFISTEEETIIQIHGIGPVRLDLVSRPDHP